ncbi:hypothetical protein CC80DRAFT_537821 [Byssothecium circinans]|uniref:Uncharacterized protein n=1 Tax=Byssothecium circinans TaxID=147558 RepID=A0A6A5TKW5_9PLEO|nr:hypothetical protein CC80DRAFT_537821 [Byssothecium circinans]
MRGRESLSVAFVASFEITLDCRLPRVITYLDACKQTVHPTYYCQSRELHSPPPLNYSHHHDDNTASMPTVPPTIESPYVTKNLPGFLVYNLTARPTRLYGERMKGGVDKPTASSAAEKAAQSSSIIDDPAMLGSGRLLKKRAEPVFFVHLNLNLHPPCPAILLSASLRSNTFGAGNKTLREFVIRCVSSNEEAHDADPNHPSAYDVGVTTDQQAAMFDKMYSKNVFYTMWGYLRHSVNLPEIRIKAIRESFPSRTILMLRTSEMA